MTAVNIFDATDEQLDKVVAARKAMAPKYDTELLDRLDAIREDIDAVRARREADRVRKAEMPRQCDRCGIDTRRPALCTDCLDSVTDMGELDRWTS